MILQRSFGRLAKTEGLRRSLAESRKIGEGLRGLPPLAVLGYRQEGPKTDSGSPFLKRETNRPLWCSERTKESVDLSGPTP